MVVCMMIIQVVPDTSDFFIQRFLHGHRFSFPARYPANVGRIDSQLASHSIIDASKKRYGW